MNIKQLIELREQLQEDLIAILDDSLTEQQMDEVCQLVVDNINQLIYEIEVEDSESGW